jgi:hypothetical protein
MLVNNTGVGSSALDFSISNVASPTALARIIATRTNRGANGDTDLTFLNYTNSALTEKMRIMDNGNVGIGTTSPKSLLEVAGSTTKTGIYIYNNSGGGGGIPRLGFKASNGYDSTSVLAAVDAVPVASANTATNLVFLLQVIILQHQQD